MIRTAAPRRRWTAAGAVVTGAAVVAVLVPTTFGTVASAAAPLQPPVVATSPGGTAVKEVVLDWAPVAGATAYVVQVGTDEQWSDTPTLQLPTVATRLTLPAWLPHASYVWRVAAVSGKAQGRWSTVGTFTRGWDAAPKLLSPLSGSIDPAAAVPTFRWTPVPTASEYQLQISTSPYFDAPFTTQAGVGTESCFTTRTSVTPFNEQASVRAGSAGGCTFSLLGTGAPLHWRVRALDHVVDGAAVVDTTPVVREGISSLPPAKAGELDSSACPEAPAPVATSAPVGAPRPQPSASASPSGAPSPSASPSPSGSPSASASASASPGGGAAEGGSCEPLHEVERGAWSSSATFSHRFALPSPAPFFQDLPTPQRPTASSDVCTDGRCRDFPTVSWASVPGAQWYRVTVSLDAAFTNVHAIAETPGLTWTPTTQWRDSTTASAYHVVVQACTIQPAADGRGPGCDAPSAPLVVRKSSPRLPTTSPADGALVGGPEVVLSWSAASSALAAATGAAPTSEAYAYRVQVARAEDPDFTSADLVEDELVDSTHFVSAEHRYADGAYLWRVQPVDASGHRLPWSTVQRFTRDSTAPTFSVVASTRLAPRGAVTVRFSEPVLGVDARSVTLSGVPARLARAADGRSAVLAPQRPLVPGATHVVGVSGGVRDRAGNPVTAKTVTGTVDPVVDDRSPVLALTGPWQRLSATNAVARTWTRSVPTPARRTAATVVLQGRGAEVKGCVGPASGVLEVWGDGRRLSRVDAYRSYSGCGVVLARAVFPTAGVHRIELRGTGTKSPRSRGTAVAVDAITAVP